MSELEVPYKPQAPVQLRKIIYYVGIVLGAVAILSVGVAAVFFRDYTVQAAALAGVINSVWLYVSNQLAVLFVPSVTPTSTGGSL